LFLVVIEYYEKTVRDAVREKEIKSFLKCKFIILREQGYQNEN
jgi:hypothetical protein|tara:strand:- start:411 stop:539 length:129 start_codon:yes stop_codon:yes gene_type:complete